MRKNSLVRQSVFRFAAIVAILAGAAPLTARAVTLNAEGVIHGDVVRLGDVFRDAGDKAQKPLGPAPRPGKDMTLDANTLMRIAVALDLPWRPETGTEHVTLRRAAVTVDPDDIQKAVEAALKDKGVAGDHRLAFEQEAGDMILPDGTEPSVEITSISYKPETKWFEANLAAPSKANPQVTARVTGRVENLESVPVLKDAIKNGTIIGARDIDFIKLPQRSLKANLILKPGDLVGMTPRMIAMPGQPITTNEIEAPRLITRGDAVTMIYASGALRLTAQGKALEHGAKGDRIRLSNASSSRTVIGEVTGEKEVTLTE